MNDDIDDRASGEVDDVHAVLPGGDRMMCAYCGDLDWTVKKYGLALHKENCPDRDEWRSQTYPYGCIGARGRARWAPGFNIVVDRRESAT